MKDYVLKWRSEEHTSELQSRGHLVCRLLLEKTQIVRDVGNRQVAFAFSELEGCLPRHVGDTDLVMEPRIHVLHLQAAIVLFFYNRGGIGPATPLAGQKNLRR